MYLDPAWYLGQHALRVPGIVAHDNACNSGQGMAIQVIDLGCRDIELAVQTAKQGLEPSALAFQRAAARYSQFDSDRGDVHGVSPDILMLTQNWRPES
ncbi:MAG: hypothetical protein PVF70_00965 [Anaerolineales bacterium]